MQRIVNIQQTQNTQTFEIDNTLLDFKYVYISRITIPIDFYMFQTGYNYIRFTVYVDDVDPGVQYTYFFNLGSPSGSDLEQELNLFFESETLQIVCNFSLETGKFQFITDYFYQIDIESDIKTQRIFGELQRISLTEFKSNYIANLIFQQQLKITSDIYEIDPKSTIDNIIQIFQIVNLQNYNLFDFPSIEFTQFNQVFSQKNNFTLTISYFDNFGEIFAKQSQIPIYYEFVFSKDSVNQNDILLNQILQQQKEFFSIIKQYLLIKIEK